VQIGKLALMQNPADEQAVREPPKEHYLTRVLDTPKTGTNTLTAPTDRPSLYEPLKDRVKFRDVKFGALVAPTLPTVDADFN
jgi:hypothetical protein